jgi:hypothetical protein
MYFNGSLKLEGAGAGVLLISPKGKQLKYVLQIFWKIYYMGSASQFHGASSGYRSTTTPQWSSTKSTSLGIAIRRT